MVLKGLLYGTLFSHASYWPESGGGGLIGDQVNKWRGAS